MRSTAEETVASLDEITVETALLYRDGLIIALLTLVPLRRRTAAALTTDRQENCRAAIGSRSMTAPMIMMALPLAVGTVDRASVWRLNHDR